MLDHIAIIMDGNRRWGKKYSYSMRESYEKGAQNVRNIVEDVLKRNIKNLTLYGLSKENLSRPDLELEIIFSIFMKYIEEEIDDLNKNGIKIKIIGNHKKLSKKIQDKIIWAEKQTEKNDKLNLFIAFSYSGREEIIDAVKAFVKYEKDLDKVTEQSLDNYMYESDMPNVDLLIRTGGEMRISNFLLWHIAYAELYFTDKYWPEFDSEQLGIAIAHYNLRKRNFGIK
jgi:undecaprenyl diphosphate synthase